jgi:zinc transport system ATP-binding protein
MPTEGVLDVRHLSVRVAGEFILDDVSFSVARGEVVAVVGPNGSGKTTLFRELLGLVPCAGEIRRRAGATFAYVPQRFSVPASLPISVTEFLLLKARRFWLPDAAFVGHLPHELGLLGLPDSVLDQPLGALSSGQLQRLLVAWALLSHPDVLLFDEPTASVDVGFSRAVYEIMRHVTRARGAAVLLISHDLNVVAAYADRVLCLNRRLLCDGPPGAVRTHDALDRLFHLHAGQRPDG